MTVPLRVWAQKNSQFVRDDTIHARDQDYRPQKMGAIVESFLGRLYDGELANVLKGPARGSWEISSSRLFFCRTGEREFLSG